ncbi:MAG: hypothetical protein KDA92_21665 [Planctomycetales bacterium]|nr:hypothetical protein [Planctomycetales bacterium]MCA9166763.1 hypothetical protein [Planctomycetales bacterium]
MQFDDTNPYATTFTERDSEPARRATLSGSAAIATVSSFGTLAYVGFSILLLHSSGSDDRNAGLLFLVNIPVLIGLSTAALRSTQMATRLGWLATFVQGTITVLMLVAQIGDPLPVVSINALIILPCLAVTIAAREVARANARIQPIDLGIR